MKLPILITPQQLQDAAEVLGLETSGLVSIHAGTERVTAVYRAKGKDGKSLVVNGQPCFHRFEIPVGHQAP